MAIFAKKNMAEGDLILQAPGFNCRPKEYFPNTDDIGIWRAKVSWAGCLVLRGVFGPSLQVGPRLSVWASDELALRVTPANYLRGLTDMDVPKIDDRLYPFQEVGRRFLDVAR